MRPRLLGLALAVLLSSVPSAAGQSPALEIRKIATPPTLDALLAPAESRALAVTDFRQRQPGDGEPASQQTAAYVAYDADHLYVAFVCKDADPSQIRARLTRREDIFSDDRVTVAINTFNDHQRAYLFIVNPLGIQADGTTTEGRGDDFSFDTLWRSEGRLTADGYVVLMAIPFKSLRFPSTDAQTWGLALGRNIPRTNESSWWPRITTRVEGFTQQLATAHGIRGVSPGRNAQLIPYGAFSGARFLDSGRAVYGGRRELRAGLDAKLVVRDAITIDAALNPDFSQVESDSPQVTVNQRFEVFFAEKRPFFIENSGLFQTPGETLFFSRRVADPQAGTRVTGKLGQWAFGGLAIDDRAAGRRLAPTDAAYDNRAFIGVVRAQRDVGNQSSVAFMATSRDFASSFNRVAAVDARVKLNANWVVSGQGVASDYSRLSTPSAGAGVLAPGGARIFDNHIVRARVDRQLTRELSVRGIVDYNAVLANPSLVALNRTKHLSADVLATYLLNPGTAIYVGYTDGYENLAFEAADPVTLRRDGTPTLSTGRQFVVKTSYLWRF